MNSVLSFWRRLHRAGAFSPTAFVVRAVIITVFFAVSQLLGLKEYTTFLSGTSANLSVSWQTASILGLIHLLLYVGFILLVPISLISAGLILAWEWWNRGGAIPDQEEAVPAHSPLDHEP